MGIGAQAENIHYVHMNIRMECPRPNRILFSFVAPVQKKNLELLQSSKKAANLFEHETEPHYQQVL